MVNPIRVESMETMIGGYDLQVIGVSRGYSRTGEADAAMKKEALDLAGQAGAGTMLDVLMGKVNPSGRLNETYPVKYEDTPAFRYFPSTERNSEYREGLFVGYRYYDTSGVRFQFPFGYGLSYTEFSYSDLEIDENGVCFTLENTGSMDGSEVVQLYVGLPGAKVFRPKKELKGFQKVFLKKESEKNPDFI